MIAMLVPAETGEPILKNVQNDLKALQGIVGGYIETLSWDAAFPENYHRAQPKGQGRITIVCNEEGKLLGLPSSFRTDIDILAGNVLIVNTKDDDFTSLTKEQIGYLNNFLGLAWGQNENT